MPIVFPLEFTIRLSFPVHGSVKIGIEGKSTLQGQCRSLTSCWVGNCANIVRYRRMMKSEVVFPRVVLAWTRLKMGHLTVRSLEVRYSWVRFRARVL